MIGSEDADEGGSAARRVGRNRRRFFENLALMVRRYDECRVTTRHAAGEPEKVEIREWEKAKIELCVIRRFL